MTVPVLLTIALFGPVSASESNSITQATTDVESDSATIEEVLGEEQTVSSDALAKARIETEAKEFQNAETLLENFVDSLELETHRFNPELIDPLIALADTQTDLKKYNAALDNYQRAIHLERVNQGLHSIDQVIAVYKEADTLLILGDGAAANKRQEYAYYVLLREYGPYSSDLLPGLFHLADWYGATNNIFSARGLFSHAVVLIEKENADKEGEGDDDLIHALQGIADTYRHQRFPPFAASADDKEWTLVSTTGERRPTTSPRPEINNYPEGEAALQRIISIRQNNAATTPEELVESILRLADWHLLWQKYSRAYPLYEHVHKILTAAHEMDPERYFAVPVRLYFPKPRDPDISELSSGDQALTGFVELTYSISARGTVAYGSIETTGSQPEGLMDSRVRRSLNRARFRPVLVEGQPVTTDNLTFTYQFAYIAPESAEVPTEEGSPEAGAQD